MFTIKVFHSCIKIFHGIGIKVNLFIRKIDSFIIKFDIQLLLTIKLKTMYISIIFTSAVPAYLVSVFGAIFCCNSFP